MDDDDVNISFLATLVAVATVIIPVVFWTWQGATADWQHKPCDSYQVWEYDQKLVPMRCAK